MTATPNRNPDMPLLVDSLRELYAWVDAWPSPDGPWQIVSERRSSRTAGAEVLLELVSPAGERRERRFDASRFAGSGDHGRYGVEPTVALDTLMERAGDFARENPPHHPGSLPRFPVPSPRYAGMIEIPLAILATDDAGRAGLYAPARVVVMRLADGSPYGIGDFPGFDPESWPPERLGDWPPAPVVALDGGRLSALVARFNGVWLRRLEAAVLRETYPQASGEREEAAAILRLLDLPTMAAIYARLAPDFWATLPLPAEETRQ